jgi:hypothetical protein
MLKTDDRDPTDEGGKGDHGQGNIERRYPIAFDRLGDGPPVVVVGGQLCDRALTRPTATALNITCSREVE